MKSTTNQVQTILNLLADLHKEDPITQDALKLAISLLEKPNLESNLQDNLEDEPSQKGDPEIAFLKRVGVLSPNFREKGALGQVV